MNSACKAMSIAAFRREETTLFPTRVGEEIFGGAHTFQRLAFSLAEGLWSPNIDVDEHIAKGVGVDAWEPFAPETYDLTRLRSRREFDSYLAVESRYFYLSSQGSIRKANK